MSTANFTGPPQIIPITDAELTYRHGMWLSRRELVRERLIEAGWSSWKLQRFDNCGSGCRSCWSESLNKRRLMATYCHDRHCEPCAAAKAHKICRNIRHHLAGAPLGEYRFITLTPRHNDRPLSEQIRHLTRSFKKLRTLPAWRKTQSGGVFLLEIKHGAEQAHPEKKRWHPHIHAITQGKFIDKHTLSNLWHQATGDSFIVDIRQPKKLQDLPRYITKYITKGTTPHVMADQALASEYILSIKGTRTAQTWGSWKGKTLTDQKEKATDWVVEATLDQLWQRARSGETHAYNILLQFRPGRPPPELE